MIIRGFGEGGELILRGFFEEFIEEILVPIFALFAKKRSFVLKAMLRFR